MTLQPHLPGFDVAADLKGANTIARMLGVLVTSRPNVTARNLRSANTRSHADGACPHYSCNGGEDLTNLGFRQLHNSTSELLPPRGQPVTAG